MKISKAAFRVWPPPGYRALRNGQYLNVWTGTEVTENQVLQTTGARPPSDAERENVEYVD